MHMTVCILKVILEKYKVVKGVDKNIISHPAF